MSVDGKLRVVIIGAGRMAGSIDDEIVESDSWPSLKEQLPYCHAACYREVDAVEVVAVCDVDEEKCRRFCERWGVPRYYLDYREMIEWERPDIASIATAAGLHAEMAVQAMEGGLRGIYCEKAMCCSLAEADAMVDCVGRHGVKFQLGAQRRHGPLFQKARGIIVSGELGELVGVSSWISGALLHTLSHLVDTGLFLAGDARPVAVHGVLGSVGSKDEIEGRRVRKGAEFAPETGRWSGDPGCLAYTAHLENGVLLTHLPAVTDVRFEAVCTDGYLRVENNGGLLTVFRRRNSSYSFDPVELAAMKPASPNLALIGDLVNCVRDGGTPLANETVARYGMEILMGAARSHLEGGATVALPLEERSMYIPSH